MNIEAAKKQAREALELAEKAIDGPWKANFPEGSNGYWHVDTNVLGQSEAATCYMDNAEMDAAFIAASRTLVPDLARTVMELAAELERVRAERDAAEYLLSEGAEIDPTP